jgi:hypothetical protein
MDERQRSRNATEVVALQPVIGSRFYAPRVYVWVPIGTDADALKAWINTSVATRCMDGCRIVVVHESEQP